MMCKYIYIYIIIYIIGYIYIYMNTSTLCEHVCSETNNYIYDKKNVVGGMNDFCVYITMYLLVSYTQWKNKTKTTTCTCRTPYIIRFN